MPGSHLVASARTPIGKLAGALASLSAADLGAIAIRAALQRGGIDAADVDHVVMGQVVQAGAGQNPARQAAVQAGIPMEVPGLTVNKVCLSGIYAIHLADQMIQAGHADVNGGAIAYGHPIGMSGVRLVLTLVEELHRRGGGLGAAALCGGGGQGDAALVKVVTSP
ncbi:MAG: hypothetical protein ACRDRP_15000 [Pseudonocardiaceae bacterium]